jgi:hypothetical protein
LKAKRQKRDVSARASVPKKYYVRKQLLQPGLQFLKSNTSENISFGQASVLKNIASAKKSFS